MLLWLMLAVGVSDAHPEQLLFRPTPTYLQGEGGVVYREQKRYKYLKTLTRRNE